ncbi:RHS repeat-associated core domain-containing protein [uncultured Dysgonomonas sp.]|uniref:RHS repeat-associated core domain-containing protein n=1 Tax=uncultured Dysgonomonas sp. TaxID=206096 RepID=UPI00261A8A36|nr:RHS repeat-associated core domain-containing protein [uncultured Dysgonomonas sp.]
MYDSQARMQDPTLGIFTTSDPLSEKKPWLSPYIYCSDNPLSRVDPDGRQDVVTTYEAYEAYAASTATTGSNMSAGQAIVELGNWLGHAYVHAVNQVIDKAVNSYKTLTGQNKQSVSQTNGENKTQGTKEIKEGKYGDVANPKNVGSGKSTTPSQRKRILEENKRQNGGQLTSDGDGRPLNQPKKNIKGQKADLDQAEVDHIEPKSKGGSNDNSNLRVISKEENLKKGNKTN